MELERVRSDLTRQIDTVRRETEVLRTKEVVTVHTMATSKHSNRCQCTRRSELIQRLRLGLDER